VSAGSTITAIYAIPGQIFRILVSGGGSISMPAGVHWADGSPTWGTNWTIISGWSDGGQFWCATSPFNS
jgi:hypothetical protein